MDRALNAIEQMVAEFTKPEYGGVVTAIELVNEPWIEAYMPNNMPWELLEEFMVKAYDVVRSTEEIIPGRHEVMVIVHDAFGSLTDWTGGFFAPGGKGHNWTNYALDTLSGLVRDHLGRGAYRVGLRAGELLGGGPT
jgi:hypothetical protein